MRRIACALIGMMLLSTAFSCTKGEDGEPSRTLTVALGSQPSTLDPRFATDANGMRISSLIFNSLVKIGPGLKVVGDAAVSWDYKDKTYHFILHPGIRFSNGRKLTKEDLLFTFEQYKSEKSPFHSGLKVIEQVEVDKRDGQLHVFLHLNQFSGKLLTTDLPVVKILPKKEVLKAGDEFGNNLLGTGSFELVNQTASEIVLAAVKGHSFAPAKSERVEFKVIGDAFTRFQKTYKGGIDIAQAEIPPAKIAAFEKNKDQFDVYKYPGLSMSYILLNLQDPQLKTPEIRRAIALAINRDEIIKYKLEGLGEKATSILTPGNPYFHAGLKPLPFDPDQARTIIGKHGLEGHKFILKTSNAETAIDKGRVIAQQLRDIGLDVEMQSYEWGTYYGDIRKGRFQMATMRWIGAMDPDIYRIAFHSAEKPPGRNRGHYENKQLDQLLEQGLAIADEKRRITHYQQVQEIVFEDLPIIPLWYNEQVSVVNKRVKQYEVSENGDFSPLIKAMK